MLQKLPTRRRVPANLRAVEFLVKSSKAYMYGCLRNKTLLILIVFANRASCWIEREESYTAIEVLHGNATS